ncbi:MAG TPA: hypothetical protein VGI22_10015 [Xanthobacteraceae bacterium]|jgi:hypothetical protein
MADRFAKICLRPQAAPVATAGRRARAASLAVVFLAVAPLAACSTGSDTGFSLFADPGKYQFHTCAQIAGELKNWSHRRQELKSLMDRADQSVGGSAVGLIAYRGDYVAAGEELDLLQSTARAKNCDQDQAWRSSTAIR